MAEQAPIYAYAYASETNPLQNEILEILQHKANLLAEIREGRYTRSIDIEKCLQDDLCTLGFMRSATVQRVAGLFAPRSDFEMDFFHVSLRMAIEVEKGKHFNLWRNMIKFCESPLIDHAVLLLPRERVGAQGPEQIFSSTMDSLRNIETLYDSVKSVLCFGY